MILSSSCALAKDESSFQRALENAPKAKAPQFDNVLVLLSTYFFDERMYTDWGQWNRDFEALNAKLARQNKNQRYHFAVAYTGMLDAKPTPLSNWTNLKHGRRLRKKKKKKPGRCIKKCAPPPPGVDVRVIMKEHMPKAHFFERHTAWYHGHYTIPLAMKNLLIDSCLPDLRDSINHTANESIGVQTQLQSHHCHPDAAPHHADACVFDCGVSLRTDVRACRCKMEGMWQRM